MMNDASAPPWLGMTAGIADQEMADSGKADGYVDGLELSPILVGKPAA
jgi:hypothetical protein